MYQVATITGKRQLTIPIDLYRRAGFVQGQKVIVSLDDTVLRVESAVDVVERLAGSLSVPRSLQRESTDTMIVQAKQQYLRVRERRRSI